MKAPINIRKRTCKQCDRIFDGGPRAWYCPTCREERRKIRASGYRKNGPKRRIGSIDQCEKCGEPYTVDGGGQRYCKKCAPDAIREKDRQQGLEWYYRNFDSYNPHRNEVRRKKTRTCIVCGKDFDPKGAPRKTCSKECSKERTKQLQRIKDAKRRKQRSKATD